MKKPTSSKIKITSITKLISLIEGNFKRFKKTKNLDFWFQYVAYNILYRHLKGRGMPVMPKDEEFFIRFENANVYLCGLIEIRGNAMAFLEEIKNLLMKEEIQILRQIFLKNPEREFFGISE